MTFTDSSYNVKLQQTFNIDKGQGCYVYINRWLNGSYGTVSFDYPNSSSILIFDGYQSQVKPGDLLGLPVTDDGWGDRKVLVVNADT